MRGTVSKRLRMLAYLRSQGQEGMVRNNKTGEVYRVSYSRERRQLKRWWNSLSAPERMAFVKREKELVLGEQVPV